MRERQAEGIEVVLKANEFETSNRALRGGGFVTLHRGHGVGSGTKPDVPDDEFRDFLGQFPRRQLQSFR